MKYVVLIITFLSFSTQAVENTHPADLPSEKTIAIAERLTDKSVGEIVQMLLKLQSECQRNNSLDVCLGVSSIMAALEYRVSQSSGELNLKSVAFIEGLLDGVADANRKVIAKISEPD